MSIIPISRLQSSDLQALGNNIRSESGGRLPRRLRRRRSPLAAINRSLSLVGERVDDLFPIGGATTCYGHSSAGL